MKNLITIQAARSLVNLKEMYIKHCYSLEEIVTEKGDVTKEDILFGRLVILELNSLPLLSRFCSTKCFIKFQLLEKVVIRQCPRIQIFSKGNTSTPSLRKVQVEDEEWYWEGDLNLTIKKLFSNKVAFHSFRHLNLSKYPELKDLWYSQSQHDIFINLKSLVVHKCNFLSDKLFSSNLLEVLHRLEELEVSDCDSLEVVFDGNRMDGKGKQLKEIAQLKKLTLRRLPNLAQIWSRDPQGIVHFHNLQLVMVEDCQNLEHLFPLSIATSLQQLREINIKQAQGMTEIVAKEEAPMDRITVFVFDQLTSLVLWNMPKLERFYAGNHTLACPSLRDIFVFNCMKLNFFKIHSTTNQGPTPDGNLNLVMQQPLFAVEELIPNLEELALNSKEASMFLQGHFPKDLFINLKLFRLYCFEDEEATFPYWFLENMPSLKRLMLYSCSFKEIFRNERLAGEEGPADRMSTRIKHLNFYNLNKLKHICEEGFKIDPVLEDLESIVVHDCPNLVNLIPSSDSFSCLTYLEVKNCNGLKNLVTTQAAKSLVQLTSLIISNCEMMEYVVHNDEEAEEIILENLEFLQLTSLSSLKCFCCGKHTFSFPSLETLIVTRCPKMKIFSSGNITAPILRAVEVENGKKRWKGDLNTTINQFP